MSRLSPDTIRDILTKHSQGQAVTKIAREYSVDSSTVRYHVEKFERVYGSTDNVYMLIKSVQKVCQHHSLKCLVCGKAQDSIHRQELTEIHQLKTKLKQANTILAREGYEII